MITVRLFDSKLKKLTNHISNFDLLSYSVTPMLSSACHFCISIYSFNAGIEYPSCAKTTKLS